MNLREQYEKLITLEKQKRIIEKSAKQRGYYFASDKEQMRKINEKIDRILEGEKPAQPQTLFTTKND